MDQLRQAAQQAQVALDELYYSNSTQLAEKLYEEASAALRAALAEQPTKPQGPETLAEALYRYGTDFVSHPASRGIDDIEEAGCLMIEASKKLADPTKMTPTELAERLKRGEKWALAEQPAGQEPVAEIEVRPHAAGGVTALVWGVSLPVGTYKLYTAPQPAIPPGYKLVPVEPTIDMLRSGVQRELADASHYGRLRDTYRAMLAAAPEVPQPAKQPLTDEEVDRVTDAQWASNINKPVYAAHRAYARAVIAAYEAKNGITKE